MRRFFFLVRLLGRVLLITAAGMVPAMLISLFMGERGAMWAFVHTIVILCIVGGVVGHVVPVPERVARLREAWTRRRREGVPGEKSFKLPERPMHAREGFIVVGLAWIVLSVAGALPFYISGEIPSFVDALFESISGFTTTGSSILTNVEGLTHGMLYWRSFTHWIGGMGVLVFLLAVSPANGRMVHLMRAEAPGPNKDKMMPRIRDTAVTLYGIYLAMTLVEIGLLIAGGMPVFDSVLHAFGTAGTGGFGIKNTSVGFYNSAYIDWVITIFMMLFGVNFSVYYLLLLRRFKEAFKMEEVRWYFIIAGGATLLIALNLVLSPLGRLAPLVGDAQATLGGAVRYAAFQVSSVMTTTGYATADFTAWPVFSQLILVLLMIVGACGGSTGGGMKVSRWVILMKDAGNAVSRMIHPNATRIVRMDEKPLEREVVARTQVFLAVYCIIAVVSMLIVSLDKFDMTTAATAVLSCFNNIGPGLGVVGPAGSFAPLSVVSKLTLSADMLLGRLEIFPILLVFTPAAWKR